MIKSTKQKLLLTIKVTFLCLSLSLLLTNKGLAQVCTVSKIDSQASNLHNSDEWLSTIAAVKKCGSPSVSALITALQHEDEEVRLQATLALGSSGGAAKKAVPALIKTLQDENQTVRASAASALGNMGIEAQEALPALSETLQDRNYKVRVSAASAVSKITAALKSKTIIQSNSRLDKAILHLETALKVLQVSEFKLTEEAIAFVRPPLNVFHPEQRFDKFDLTSEQTWQEQLLVGSVIYAVSLPSFWFIILWLRPLWLLRINNTLKHHTDFTLPVWFGSIKVPLRYLLFINFFDQHPRVLDAWVEAHADIVREGFEKAQVRQQDNKPPSVIPESSKVASTTELDDYTVSKYAKAIAWECLKQSYQPSSIKRQDALAVIAALDKNYHPEAYLQHLENLGLIQIIVSTQDKICFVRPMLAEYLAASYLVELCGNNETKWHEFLAQADAMPNQEAIKGFLFAVWDCCLSLSDATKIPGSVLEELRRRAALNAEQTKIIQHL